VQFVDLIGISAFAVSGALMAIRRDFDVVGIAILAVVTGLGGGIIRDLVLGDTPPPAFTRWEYLVVALAAAAITSVAHPGIARLAMPLLVFDAAGLGGAGRRRRRGHLRRPRPRHPAPLARTASAEGPTSGRPVIPGRITLLTYREERTDMPSDERHAVVVLGGVAAGPSGALALARAPYRAGGGRRPPARRTGRAGTDG
jgi:hypothetical protein